MMNSLVKCDSVYVASSTLVEGELGVFAAHAFDVGDVIETGLARVLTNVDGHENSHLFTWSDDVPNTTWAITSGCAPYYNCSSTCPNTAMTRNFVSNRFVINAIKPIRANDELFHTYKSLEWRECFRDLV
jgi:hypothetical protein